MFLQGFFPDASAFLQDDSAVIRGVCMVIH